MTDSQSQKGWKRGITAPERHYQSNVKQALLLRLLGVLDSHHPPEKVRKLYTRKPSRRDGRGDKSQQPCLPNTWAARTWEGHRMQAQSSLRLWGLPECLSLSDLDLGGACSPGQALDGSGQSNLKPKLCAPRAGAGPVWLRHCEHMPVLFVCSVPPSPQCNWTSEPKKSVHHHPPCVRVEIRHWRDQQTEKDKTEEPSWMWQMQWIKTLSLVPTT